MTDTYHARLAWDSRGQPLSCHFDDVYFSRENGLGETRHVFLAGNRLEERFARLQPGECFVIGETGFGTGLNFLCAWQLFEQKAPPGARLQFVSVEKYPLTRADLQQALQLWPELSRWTGPLLERYLAIHPGYQRLVFAGGRISLTLLIGDVLDELPRLDARVNAWFLDGFAPAKNPGMWTDALFSQLARLSAPGATLGTFTSAGFVRRGLQAAGFDMQRVPGHGRKREILQGQLSQPAPETIAPWYARPPARPDIPREAIVVGAGLAGCATAASLAARGWRVRLVERHAYIAREGSGNPQGVLYLKLSAHHTALSQLVVSGFGFSRRLLPDLSGQDYSACGVLQLAFDARETKRQQQLAAAFPADLLHPLDQTQASQQAGIPVPAGGLFFPEAGWLHPPALCQWLACQPGIELLGHHEPLELIRQHQHWQVLEHGQLLAEAPVVVLAAAEHCNRFSQTRWLPLKRIRGQITTLAATPASQHLGTVVCAEGYVAPAWQGQHTLGASFAFDAMDLQPSLTEQQDNLSRLEAISPALHQTLTAEPPPLRGRAAFRCTSPDYLPLVGPLADAATFAETYAALAKDARQQPDLTCPWLDGLYVNTAHGSRGLLTAPLAAELLAAWLDDEPLPLPRAVAEACHPNRFLLRQLIRARQN